MKNIAIFGSSRSGKTTLAKMISKKYPRYHVFIGDDIRWAFQDVLQYTNINSTGGTGMTNDFPNFLASLFYQSIKSNKNDFSYIVETCDVTPQKAHKLFNREDTILLFLGTPRLTIEGYFYNIRKYQTKEDWTYRKSDAEILEHAKTWTSKSKEYEKDCSSLDIWFVDTSFNRKQVLNETITKIEKLINVTD